MTDQAPSFEERKWQHELQVQERKWQHELKREDATRARRESRDFHTYINKGAVETANLISEHASSSMAAQQSPFLLFWEALLRKRKSILCRSVWLPVL